MNKQEYARKRREIDNAMYELDGKRRELNKAYAADLAKLNGLEPGAIIEDSRGVKYSFAEVFYSWRLEVRGYKLKKDGTPSARLESVWGYKLKEE